MSSAKQDRRALLAALFLMAISGVLLHTRIHPFMAPLPQGPPERLVFRLSFLSATILPLLDAVVVTWLFSIKRTAVYGYLLNGLIVIYGTVLMAHFSIAGLLAQSAPLRDWIFKTTLPDIGLAWADFFVGKALYSAWMKQE